MQILSRDWTRRIRELKLESSDLPARCVVQELQAFISRLSSWWDSCRVTHLLESPWNPTHHCLWPTASSNLFEFFMQKICWCLLWEISSKIHSFHQTDEMMEEFSAKCERLLLGFNKLCHPASYGYLCWRLEFLVWQKWVHHAGAWQIFVLEIKTILLQSFRSSETF